jgi:hypothetical protein
MKYPAGTMMDVNVTFDEKPSRAYWCDVCTEYTSEYMEPGDTVGFGEIKQNDSELWEEIKAKQEREAQA